MSITRATADPSEWPGEPDPGRLVVDFPAPGEPRQADWDDGPASPPGYGPSGHEWATEVDGARWYLALARRSWLVVIGACAAVTLIVISVMQIVSQQPLRALTTDCRTAPCHAALPGVAAALRRSAGVSAHIPSAGPSATLPPPVATPEPSSAPPGSTAVATAAQVSATVHYHVLLNVFGSVVGKFTIINDSSSYITGWQLTAVFPGDQVQTVIGASDPGPGSDVLIMDAPAGSALPPGGRTSGIFVALGHRAHPARCTFDAMAC